MIQKRSVSVKNFLFLHLTVLIFAVAAVGSKFASNSLAEDGIFSVGFIGGFAAYGILTVIYAILWQVNLEKYKLSFLYMNRAFYMVWTQLFAITIFGDEIYLCNIIGLILIIVGVMVNSKDA